MVITVLTAQGANRVLTGW